jgi:glycosyltransferase involved in cell wall biosynthesis
MFTIIVPTHNRPQLLQRTLQSWIAQTYRAFTVIIVDDAGSYIPPFAELSQLTGRFNYLIRSGENGPAKSRNMALALNESRYVLFLDDDDTLESRHLETLAQHIGERQPPLLFCDFRVQYESRTSWPPQAGASETISIADVTADSVFVRNRIPNSCLVYRQDVVAGLRYDTVLDLYEDWEFLLQCLRGHGLEHVATPTVVIHKTAPDAPENMRRGNSRNERVIEVTLDMFRRHPAPNPQTRLARQSLLFGAGLSISLDQC